MTVPTFEDDQQNYQEFGITLLFFIANLTRQTPCTHAKNYFQGKLLGENLTGLRPILQQTREQISHYPYRSEPTPHS
jgi:hypothetical protein